MTDSQDPHANPPGWTDPYADLNDLSGDEPLQPMEPPTTPPAQPPGSPLLTGLIIGLLLIALSVAVFQLLSPEDDGTATGETTTTTLGDGETTTTLGDGETTTSVGETTTTSSASDPWEPLEPAIEVDRLKLKTDGIRINRDNIPDIDFGTDAETAIGRLVASFGDPTEDNGWQLSTGKYGVCAGDPERVVIFGTFAAVVTKPGGTEIFNGYRQDLDNGDFTHEAAGIETLSGLALSDTVAELRDIYGESQDLTFENDPRLGEIFRVTSSSGTLLLWGPVEGSDDQDRVLGIYGPDECGR